MAARVRALATGSKLGLYSTPSIVQGEGASQTFKKGAVLVNGSAGNVGMVVEAGADPSGILGVAEEDGKNLAVGVGSCRFVPAIPNQVFEMTIDDGTGTYALVAGDKNKQYGIAKDGSGIWYIDQTDTTNLRVTIIGFKDAVGTQAARVYCVFRSSQTAYN